MMTRITACVTVVAALSLAALLGLSPSQPDSSPNLQSAQVGGLKATVDDLAFITGHWRGGHEGDILDEIWSDPAGDCMMGVFRWIKDGKVWMYEFLTFRNEDDGVTLRFRHFAGDLRPWEDGKPPLILRLVEFEPSRAVFEFAGDDDPPWKMIFRKLDEENLTITIESEPSENGQSKRQDFVYRLVI